MCTQTSLSKPLRWGSALYLSTFLTSLVWFGVEFSSRIKADNIPWGAGSFLSLAMLGATITTLYLLVRFRHANHIVSWFLVFCAVFIIHVAGTAPLIAVTLLLFVSLLVGQVLLERFGLKQRDGMHHLLATGFGIGLYATLISLLVLLPVNYPSVYFGILLLPLMVWRSRLRSLVNELLVLRYRLNAYAVINPVSFLAIFWLIFIYLFAVLMPETGHDALSMHLLGPAYISDHHRWGFDVEKHAWAVIPQNGDWIYTLMYMLGGEPAARLANFALMLTLAASLGTAVRRWADTQLMALALLVFLSLPLTHLVTTSLFIENALALFIFSALVCIVLFVEHNDNRYLLCAAVFLGLGMGTKATTLLMMVPLSVVVLFYLLRGRVSTISWKQVISFGLIIFFLFGAIPYVIAYVKTGNPVFPFFNAIFKSTYFDTQKSFDNPLFKQGLHWLTLRDMTFDSAKFLEGQPGAFGWVFFVLLPLTALAAVLSRIRFAATFVLVSFVFVALVFRSQSYLRYIYPAVPLLIVVIVQGIQGLHSERFRTAVIGAVWVLVLMNILFLPAAGWNYRDLNFRMLYSAEHREEFQLRWMPIRRAVEFINLTEGTGARVGVFAHGLIAGLKGVPFIASWHNYTFNAAVQSIQSDAQLPELISLLRDNGVGVLILDDTFNPGGSKSFLVPMLKSITVLDRQFGHISVRTVKKDLIFSEERLQNPDFQSMEGWFLVDTNQFQVSTNSIIVSSEKTATQAVKVAGRMRYQLSATVRCVVPGSMFRLQVNWLDKRGEFLGADITPITCTNQYLTVSNIVKAPDFAVAGVIYATGHSDTDQVEYKSLSFK